MIVFKTALKVLNKCKVPIIMYTAFLILFGGINMQANNSTTDFVESKPAILVINNDEEKGITKNFIKYINSKSEKIKIADTENAINDALFYRDVDYIVYIPKNYREDFLNQKNPTIDIKTTSDSKSSYAELIVSRYIKIANMYSTSSYDEEQLINKINETLSKEVKVNIDSKLDVTSLSKATVFYNFSNYSLTAGCLYVIALVLSIFNSEKIKKRTVISSINYKKYNKSLLLSSSLFAFALWLIYVILSYILIGSVIFTSHGLLYILNSFIFVICILAAANMIGNLVKNGQVISSMVNVIALGSSFISGAFVPASLIPKSVLSLSRILPSYWYIKTNDTIKTIETINMTAIKPLFINMGVIILFTILFIYINNVVTKKNRKIN